MPLSGALTSTIVLRGYTRALTGASKNKAPIADPVMQAVLRKDRMIGPFIGRLLGRYSLLDLGGGQAAATAEGAAQAAASALTPVNVAPQPSRREYARDLLDSERTRLAGLGFDGLSASILDALVGEAFDIWANSLMNDVEDLGATAGNVIGVTNTALAWDALQNGFLELINRGGLASGVGAMAFLKLQAVKDLGADAMSLGGAVQMSSQVQQFLSLGGNGFIGEFFGPAGRGLRIYMVDDVPHSHPDDQGLMAVPEGLATAHEIVPLPEDSADVLLQAGGDTGWITVEAKRSTTTSAGTRVETAFRFGAAIADTNGVAQILSKG